MDMPYANHHSYLVAFLQLAFLPQGAGNAEDLLLLLRYPRGPTMPPLSRAIWIRMISRFAQTSRESMFMKANATMQAVGRLKSHSNVFPDVPAQKVNGVNASHVLRRVASVEIDFSPQTTELTKECKCTPSERKDHESATSKSSSFATTTKKKKSSTSSRKSRKQFWRNLLGGTKA